MMATARHSCRRRARRQRPGVVAVEAAVLLPVVLTFMFGIWEVGRLAHVNQSLSNAAREGARLAAGGYVNGTGVTAATVQQAVRDYLSAAGFPAAAVSGAQISLVCQATPGWTDPCNALPLDPFQVTLTIPAGAAFDSLRWSFVTQITAVRQLTTTVTWESLNNSKVVVNTQLPY